MKRISWLSLVVAASAFAAEVKVDFDAETGPVKPVNAVGQPPMIGASNVAAVMLANNTRSAMPLACDFGGRAVTACRLTDDTRTDAFVALPTELPPYSFCAVILGSKD